MRPYLPDMICRITNALRAFLELLPLTDMLFLKEKDEKERTRLPAVLD